MTIAAMNLVIPQRMCLHRTVTEIWRLEDNGVTTLTFWGHVTIQLLGVDFLWVVHSDHASIWHHYGDMVV